MALDEATKTYSVSLRRAPSPSLIQTVLMLTNSRIPNSLNSLPYPDCFTPPKGSRGSEAVIPFTNTIPESNSSTKRLRSAGSFVQTLLPRPKMVSFATRIASSRSATRKMGATGPKSSS